MNPAEPTPPLTVAAPAKSAVTRTARIVLLGIGLLVFVMAYFGFRALSGNPNKGGPAERVNGYQELSFDRLSDFPFTVYEVMNPSGGRPLLKSDHSIPASVRAYDGKRVTVRGYVLALKLKKGLVQDFLLLRDQGTCCFGEAAQINHFIRVTLKQGGFEPGTVTPVKVSGSLRVGEIYVQGYLTGIYAMEADKVEL